MSTCPECGFNYLNNEAAASAYPDCPDPFHSKDEAKYRVPGAVRVLSKDEARVGEQERCFGTRLLREADSGGKVKDRPCPGCEDCTPERPEGEDERVRLWRWPGGEWRTGPTPDDSPTGEHHGHIFEAVQFVPASALATAEQERDELKEDLADERNDCLQDQQYIKELKSQLATAEQRAERAEKAAEGGLLTRMSHWKDLADEAAREREAAEAQLDQARAELERLGTDLPAGTKRTKAGDAARTAYRHALSLLKEGKGE